MGFHNFREMGGSNNKNGVWCVCFVFPEQFPCHKTPPRALAVPWRDLEVILLHLLRSTSRNKTHGMMWLVGVWGWFGVVGGGIDAKNRALNAP